MPLLPPRSRGRNAKHFAKQAEKMHDFFRDWECCTSRYTCVPEVRCVVHGTKPFQDWKTRVTARTAAKVLPSWRVQCPDRVMPGQQLLYLYEK